MAWRRATWLGMAAALAVALAGCATTPAPRPASMEAASMDAEREAGTAYGYNMLRLIEADAPLMQLLATLHVTQTLRVALVVDPDGFVERGVMLKGEQPEYIESAILNTLINLNFGSFTRKMPPHRMIYILPVQPPAAPLTVPPPAPPPAPRPAPEQMI